MFNQLDISNDSKVDANDLVKSLGLTTGAANAFINHFDSTNTGNLTVITIGPYVDFVESGSTLQSIMTDVIGYQESIHHSPRPVLSSSLVPRQSSFKMDGGKGVSPPNKTRKMVEGKQSEEAPAQVIHHIADVPDPSSGIASESTVSTISNVPADSPTPAIFPQSPVSSPTSLMHSTPRSSTPSVDSGLVEALIPLTLDPSKPPLPQQQHHHHEPISKPKLENQGGSFQLKLKDIEQPGLKSTGFADTPLPHTAARTTLLRITGTDHYQQRKLEVDTMLAMLQTGTDTVVENNLVELIKGVVTYSDDPAEVIATRVMLCYQLLVLRKPEEKQKILDGLKPVTRRKFDDPDSAELHRKIETMHLKMFDDVTAKLGTQHLTQDQMAVLLDDRAGDLGPLLRALDPLHRGTYSRSDYSQIVSIRYGPLPTNECVMDLLAIVLKRSSRVKRAHQSASPDINKLSVRGSARLTPHTPVRGNPPPMRLATSPVLANRAVALWGN
jgi:hypothetical protein